MYCPTNICGTMLKLMRLLGIGVCMAFQLSMMAQGTIEKDFEFDEESDTATLIVQVQPGISTITCKVSSEIHTGTLEVKLVDPQKNGKGTFTLETTGKDLPSDKHTSKSKTKRKTQRKTKSKTKTVSKSSSTSSTTDSDGSYSYTMVSSDNSSVKGNMHKEFENPIPGV